MIMKRAEVASFGDNAQHAQQTLNSEKQDFRIFFPLLFCSLSPLLIFPFSLSLSLSEGGKRFKGKKEKKKGEKKKKTSPVGKKALLIKNTEQIDN